MLTIERESEADILTVMDNGGRYQDLQVIVTERSIFLRQYNVKTDAMEVIEINAEMLALMVTGMQLPEGTYMANGEIVIH